MRWKVIVQADGSLLFAVTRGDYEVLGKNLAELLRWSQEANWQLGYYRGEQRPAEAPPK